MAPLLSFLSWSTLAVLFASFSSSPVAALSVNMHDARMSPNHGELARRMAQPKRVKRCKPRASVPPAPASTSSQDTTSTSTDAPKPTSSAPAPPPPKPSSSSSSSKPKPTSAPSAPAASNPWALCPNKRMLAWGAEADFLKDWNSLAQRIYTWGPTTNSDVAQYGVKSCAMLWGERDVQNFADKVLNSDAEVDCALHVNEPEIPSQANMSPQRAAQLWVENMIPLKQKKGTVIVTPALTSDTPTNTKWYDAFFQACADQTGSKTCQADAMALHYYDISAQGFQDFLNMMHDRYGLPILVTEFADHNFNGGAQANNGQVWDFAGQMKSFFDSTDWIVCYAPFGAILESQLPDINKLNAIMGDNHLPTDLGHFYYS